MENHTQKYFYCQLVLNTKIKTHKFIYYTNRNGENVWRFPKMKCKSAAKAFSINEEATKSYLKINFPN